MKQFKILITGFTLSLVACAPQPQLDQMSDIHEYVTELKLKVRNPVVPLPEMRVRSIYPGRPARLFTNQIQIISEDWRKTLKPNAVGRKTVFQK